MGTESYLTTRISCFHEDLQGLLRHFIHLIQPCLVASSTRMKEFVLPSQPSPFLEEQIRLLLEQYHKGVRTFTRASFKGGKVEVVAPSLPHANLSHLDLRDINLNKANLAQINGEAVTFLRADLSESNLIQADLRSANLSRAKLRRANLKEAYLVGADLSNADLSAANLTQADLSGAYLEEASLQGAILTQTRMPDGSVHE
jgi:uncharacterized protein YjbI with pentapeptide repeats